MHQKSFTAFGFGAGSTIGSMTPSRRGSQINVNVTPSQTMEGVSETPEIRKYKKRFSSDILCAALWGEYFYFYHFYDYNLYYSIFLLGLHCYYFWFLPVALEMFNASWIFAIPKAAKINYDPHWIYAIFYVLSSLFILTSTLSFITLLDQ